MINNRQNGRRRGRTGGAPRPNGGGAPERGSRLDNRARGNASQLHEKYKTLAADAQRQGDRVMTEYYLQFADHYFRVLSETRSRFDEQQQNQRRDRFDGQPDSGEDDEDNDGDVAIDDRVGDRQQDRQQDRRAPRGQDWSQERPADRDGNRVEGRGDRDGNRRNDGQRGDNFREEGRRHEATAPDREQGEQRQPRRRRFEERPENDMREQPVGIEAESGAMDVDTSPMIDAAPAPVSELPLEAPVAERRPRGRPRKVVAPVDASVEIAPEPLGTDRLPPALTSGDEGVSAEDDAQKPRRRVRRPRGEAATADA